MKTSPILTLTKEKKILSYTSYFFGCKKSLNPSYLCPLLMAVMSYVSCLLLAFIFPRSSGHWQILKGKENINVWYINWSFVYRIRTSLSTLATELPTRSFSLPRLPSINIGVISVITMRDQGLKFLTRDHVVITLWSRRDHRKKTLVAVITLCSRDINVLCYHGVIALLSCRNHREKISRDQKSFDRQRCDHGRKV